MAKDDKGEYAAPVKKADTGYREFEHTQKRKYFSESEEEGKESNK